MQLDMAGEETVLYSFPGGAEGSSPNGSLFRDSAGDLYGTTSAGGNLNGVIFKVSGRNDETLLFSFPAGGGGYTPYSGLFRDSDGNLYGTADAGGATGNGTVYEVTAAGSGKVLYAFKGGNDGAGPFGGVVRDATGNLYGTTSGGGASGAGTVYELNSSGNESVIYSFTGFEDGSNPYSGLRLDKEGNLYGTTDFGGAGGYGVVYKLTAAGEESVLHTFTGGSDGEGPFAGVTLDSAGNLYGTTESGGTPQFGSFGYGVVYKVDPSGNESVLYTFPGGQYGATPTTAVTLDGDGNIYGTTYLGGSSNYGIVYKLDASGIETVLYSFTGGADGGNPSSALVRDSAGNLYGTTQVGGVSDSGVVYSVDPAGVETVLYSFNTVAGEYPTGSLCRSSSGNLYGTTSAGGKHGAGVVFEIRP